MRRTILFFLTAACSPAVPSTQSACSGPDSGLSEGQSIEVGDYTVELVSLLPAIPDVGDNSWQFRVSQQGAMIEDVDVQVIPWMPRHGHGLVPANYEGTLGAQPGVFEINTFNLFMPGLWEFDVVLTGASVDASTTISFCAEG